MKWVSRVLLTLLLLLILTGILFYFSMQTSIGTGWIGRWISSHSGYEMSASKIDYRFPMQFQVQDLSVSVDKQPVLIAKSALLDFAFVSWLKRPKLQTLTLQQGTFDLNDKLLPVLPVKVDQLQLKNMALNWHSSRWQVSATEINAGIRPWMPTMEKMLAKESRFEMSAGRLIINGMQLDNLFLRGGLEKGRVILQDFGTDIAQGALTGRASQQQDGSWLINNMQLSHVRWQTDKTIRELWRYSTQLPPLHIEYFNLLDARMEGNGWAFNDLNVSLNQVLLQQEKISAQQGSANLSAGNFIVGSLALTDPVARVQLSSTGVEIRQFSTHWQNGLIRSQGRWLRNNRELQLDTLEVAALEYTLPLEWYRWWSRPLPNWLNRLSINKLKANHNLLIAIDPQFPFQFTQLGGYGDQLVLVDTRQDRFNLHFF